MLSRTQKSCLWTVLVLFAFAARPVMAQWMMPRAPVFNSVLDAHPYFNGFERTGNPALLRASVHPEVMNLRLAYSRKEGDMAGFFDPAVHGQMQQQASVRRDIGEVHVVQGGFAVEQDRRSDWAWLATRDYEDAGPFFFGDSTAGGTRYNALILDGAYSRDFGDRWSTGLSMAYRVDNGLKQVSPRPTSEHRDIRVTAGAAYRPSPHLTLGLHARVDDFQEEIRYRTDEGAVMEDTRLVKFRGYDFPQVVNSQVETRFADRNGVYGGLSAGLDLAHLRLLFHTEYGPEQGEVRDDPLSQRPEGYWAGDQMGAGGALEATPVDAITVAVRYDLRRRTRWARHPHFDVLLSEYERLDQSIVTGISYQASPAVRTGIEFRIGDRRINEHDYHADISHDADGSAWDIRAGAEFKRRFFELIGMAGLGGYACEQSIRAEIASSFFAAHRKSDLEILGQDNQSLFGALGIAFDLPFPGRIRSDARLIHYKADGGYFDGKQRTEATFSLSYEVGVF